MRHVGIAALAAVLSACGGGNQIRPSSQVPEPSWLAEGNRVVNTDAGKQIHAIGAVSGVRDSRARRQQADQKARTQLGQLMEQLYAGIAKLGDGVRPEEVSAVGKKAVAQSAQIMDHWVAADGTESALEVVDLAQFKGALRKVDGDDRVKQEIASNLEKAAEQMAR